MKNTDKKPFYQSKTLWANVVLFLLYLLAYPQLSQVVPPQVAGTLTAILNVLLRFVTSQAVTV